MNYDDEWVTPHEAARILKVADKTVYRYAKAGKIDSARTIGGHRRYNRAQLEALVRQRTHTPDRDTPDRDTPAGDQ